MVVGEGQCSGGTVFRTGDVVKDIFSKVTFGFLMAQLVPGMIVILSLSVAYVAQWKGFNQSLLDALGEISTLWFSTGLRQMAFGVFSTGAGMLIHGIQWATLGYLESKHQSVLKLRWHNNVRLINQVLIGPIMIIWEILRLVFGAKTIKEVGIKENVTKIDDQKMAAFHFLQDFYLHFAQFYSHTSYALVICFISVLVFIIHAGFTYPRLAILIAIYLLCGLFYIIGRIQFQSLFKGESELVSRPRRPPFNYRF